VRRRPVQIVSSGPRVPCSQILARPHTGDESKSWLAIGPPRRTPDSLQRGAARNPALASSRLSATPPLRPCVGRPQQYRPRYGKPERLGGLEVQDRLEFCRQLHWEIARLLAAQDAIDIGGGATKGLAQVDFVGEQAAASGKVR